MKLAVSMPITVTLMIAAIQGGVVSAPTRVQAQQQVQPAPLAQLIETMGVVEIKREKGSNYQTAKVGENLYLGDLVRVAKGAKGVVRCTTNSRTWTIPDDKVPRGVANVCSPPS
jgi:DNA-binding IscR family transcriptional regulator